MAAFAGIAKGVDGRLRLAGSIGTLRVSKETAAAVPYLASDDSGFTTGIDVVVNGGMFVKTKVVPESRIAAVLSGRMATLVSTG